MYVVSKAMPSLRAPTIKTTHQLRSHLAARGIPTTVVHALAKRCFPDCDPLTLGLLSTEGFSSAALVIARGSDDNPDLVSFRKCVYEVEIPRETGKNMSVDQMFEEAMKIFHSVKEDL